MLVGLASFEENGFSADAAGEASLRRVLGGACHSMILLADMGFVKQAKTRIPQLQFADQINTDHAKPIPHRSYGNWETRRGYPLDGTAQKEIHGSGMFLPVSMSEMGMLRQRREGSLAKEGYLCQITSRTSPNATSSMSPVMAISERNFPDLLPGRMRPSRTTTTMQRPLRYCLTLLTASDPLIKPPSMVTVAG